MSLLRSLDEASKSITYIVFDAKRGSLKTRGFFFFLIFIIVLLSQTDDIC